LAKLNKKDKKNSKFYKEMCNIAREKSSELLFKKKFREQLIKCTKYNFSIFGRLFYNNGLEVLGCF